MLEQRDVRVQPLDLGQVVRRVDDGGAVAREVAHGLQDVLARRRVGARGRLVEDHELRPVDERDRRVQAALLAARQAPGRPLGEAVSANGSSSSAARAFAALRPQAVQLGERAQVGGDGELRVDADLLRRDPDLPAHRARARRGVGAEHADRRPRRAG